MLKFGMLAVIKSEEFYDVHPRVSLTRSYMCRYESGWKAVLAYTDGVILVYDPDSPGQDQQLTLWYDYFVKRNGLRDEQCLIFAHRGNSTEKFKPRKCLSCLSATVSHIDAVNNR
jgi:hypothetical protein